MSTANRTSRGRRPSPLRSAHLVALGSVLVVALATSAIADPRSASAGASANPGAPLSIEPVSYDTPYAPPVGLSERSEPAARSGPSDNVLRPSRGGDAIGDPRQPRTGLAPAAGGLMVVVGLFLILAWGLKRWLPSQAQALPDEAVELLGRAPLAERQHLQLLRLGGRLLLVSVSSSGAATLAEIRDPQEVEALTRACRRTGGFRDVLDRVAREEADRA